MKEPKQFYQYLYLVLAAAVVLLSWVVQRPLVVSAAEAAAVTVSVETDNSEAEWQRIYGGMSDIERLRGDAEAVR
ncbi:hypothetical protein [Neisseria sp. S1]|uniref:hypothetical protein n=1 Tax=Neisseria sp. S1 TaxID=3318354 RepID=UPI003A8C535A